MIYLTSLSRILTSLYPTPWRTRDTSWAMLSCDIDLISTLAERSRAGVTSGKRLRNEAATVDSGRRVTKR